MLFFSSAVVPLVTPTAVATSIGVSTLFQPLTTAMYGALGAIQGIVGMYALTALGYATCSIVTAGLIGFLAGAAIAAPFLILTGLGSILPSSDADEDDEQSFATTIAGFALNIGVMFVASLAISTALFLGTAPAVTVAAGAAITDLAIEGVRDVASFAIS